MTSADAVPSAEPPDAATLELKLEVVVIPVSDVDRAKEFYLAMGCRLDADFVAEDGLRIVQVTPPGSACSINFGTRRYRRPCRARPDALMLIVYDVEAARAELIGRGIEVSEVFHDAGGVFHHAGQQARVPGPDPEGRSYSSFASFQDPDGNGWLLQEIRTRLPGR